MWARNPKGGILKMLNVRARLGAMAGVGAIVAAGMLSPVGANAARQVGDVAVFHTSPANSIVCWVGNACTGATGTYTFNTAGGSCSGIDDTKTGTCAINSSGNFTSIVCGTGSVLPTSVATITENDGDVITVNQLSITFVAGLGVSQGNASETGGGSGKGRGVVQITASSPQAPNAKAQGKGVCTNGFSVEAVAVAAI
jgi:hypothetical protein